MIPLFELIPFLYFKHHFFLSTFRIVFIKESCLVFSTHSFEDNNLQAEGRNQGYIFSTIPFLPSLSAKFLLSSSWLWIEYNNVSFSSYIYLSHTWNRIPKGGRIHPSCELYCPQFIFSSQVSDHCFFQSLPSSRMRKRDGWGWKRAGMDHKTWTTWVEKSKGTSIISLGNKRAMLQRMDRRERVKWERERESRLWGAHWTFLMLNIHSPAPLFLSSPSSKVLWW